MVGGRRKNFCVKSLLEFKTRTKVIGLVGLKYLMRNKSMGFLGGCLGGSCVYEEVRAKIFYGPKRYFGGQILFQSQKTVHKVGLIIVAITDATNKIWSRLCFYRVYKKK